MSKLDVKGIYGLDLKNLNLLLSFFVMGEVCTFLSEMLLKLYSVHSFTFYLFILAVVLSCLTLRFYGINESNITFSRDLINQLNDPDIKTLNLKGSEIDFYELSNFRFNMLFLSMIGLIFSILGFAFSDPNSIVFILIFSLLFISFLLSVFVFFSVNTVNKLFHFNISNDFYFSSERLSEIHECLNGIKNRTKLQS